MADLLGCLTRSAPGGNPGAAFRHTLPPGKRGAAYGVAWWETAIARGLSFGVTQRNCAPQPSITPYTVPVIDCAAGMRNIYCVENAP